MKYSKWNNLFRIASCRGKKKPQPPPPKKKSQTNKSKPHSSEFNSLLLPLPWEFGEQYFFFCKSSAGKMQHRKMGYGIHKFKRSKFRFSISCSRGCEWQWGRNDCKDASPLLLLSIPSSRKPLDFLWLSSKEEI